MGGRAGPSGCTNGKVDGYVAGVKEAGPRENEDSDEWLSDGEAEGAAGGGRTAGGGCR